nr:DHH family phosphoesterase [Acholeplasmatales bacterium]
MNYFNTVAPSWVQNHIHYMPHKNKHHGIVLEDIPKGTKLVIALDASSNEYEIHKELKERGIDVLVIDHHLADHVSEDAIVINNQLCDYPNKALSGVGMVYKFCCLFDFLLEQNEADNYLDLVALGMTGDMMDLRSLETKHLINKGFAQVRSPFIKEMMNKNAYNLGDTLTPM